MKKLLVLALTGLLVFSFGVSTMAGTAYVDWLVGGNMEDNDSLGTNDGDLTDTVIIGFHHSDQKTKFEVEYLQGIWNYEGQEDYDFSVADMRCGLQLFDDNFITIGMVNGDIEAASYRSYIAGLDLSFNLSDSIVFEGTAGFSFSSDFEWGNGNSYDSTHNLYKIRMIYIFAERFAGSLGYRYSKVTLDNPDNTEILHSGFTLGLSTRF